MHKERVLFVCVHNSARSQMAEAFLKALAGDRFDVMSGGFEPGVINPLVVEVMKEVGIDISQNKTKSVFDLYKQGELFSYVITVCDAGTAQACPFLPGLLVQRINWSFDDPSNFTGTREEKLAKTRVVRDAIKAKIKDWLQTIPDIGSHKREKL